MSLARYEIESDLVCTMSTASGNELALVLTLSHRPDGSWWYIDVLPGNGLGEFSPWPIDQIPTGLPQQRRPDEQTLQEIAAGWARSHGCG